MALRSAKAPITHMTQEFPMNLSLSFPHEPAFAQENEVPGGYRLEPHQARNAKATGSEQEGSTSPLFNQRDSHPFDTVDGDGEYKDLLFTFPRLYSDMAVDKDPFLDRAMPLNPHNTPISLSGNQSQLGSWRKDKQNALFIAKSDKNTINRVHKVAPSSDDLFGSLFNSRRARPPGPTKPSFLSDIGIPFHGRAENIPPFLESGPIEQSVPRDRRPVTPSLSLPLRTGRNVSQYAERPIIEQYLEPRPSRPKQSWETRSIIPCRYFSRPFSTRELEILGIPLKNPDMPFPAPIPTVDKLPLRRGIIDFDCEQIDQGPSDCEESTIKQTTSASSLPIRQLPQHGFSLGKLATNMLRIFPWRRGISATKENQSAPTTMIAPCLSRCETLPIGPEPLSAVGTIDGACILQINIVFPVVDLQHIAAIVAAIRGYMPSRIGLKVLSLTRLLFELTFRWLLVLLRIEIAAEMKRLQDYEGGLM
jgi:F-type H+-transporting ATPase subunit delta